MKIEQNKVFLNSKLLTSDNEEYENSPLKVADFIAIIEKTLPYDPESSMNWKNVSPGLIELRIDNESHNPWSFEQSEVNILTFYHVNVNGYEPVTYLLTIDRGEFHIFDSDRFIPSSAVIEMVIYTAAIKCGNEP